MTALNIDSLSSSIIAGFFDLPSDDVVNHMTDILNELKRTKQTTAPELEMLSAITVIEAIIANDAMRVVDAIKLANISIFCSNPGTTIDNGIKNLTKEIATTILKAKGVTVNNTTPQATTPVSSPRQIIKAIKPELANSINSILNLATEGKLKSLDDAVAEMDVLERQLVQARNDAADANQRALVAASKRAVVSAPSGTVETPVGKLTYEVVMKKAGEVFDSRAHGLKFDIPTLVWKDSNGKQFKHPLTPDIDPNYEFDAVALLKFLTGSNRGSNIWLFGHTGTGKSSFVEQIAARTGFPLNRINLDSNLERADIVGKVDLIEQGGTTVTKFEEGVLPKAMPQPGYFLLDEFDAGRPDILFVIQRALESKGLMLTEDSGRVVMPHELFRFVATANTRGQGDEYGMYAGVRVMNNATIDRFPVFIEFDYLPPAKEKVLLKSLVPALPDDMANKLTQFAKEIRTAFGKGEVYNTISPRGLVTMADCYVTFLSIGVSEQSAFQTAFEMSCLDKVTADTRQKFIELSTRIFTPAV